MTAMDEHLKETIAKYRGGHHFGGATRRPMGKRPRKKMGNHVPSEAHVKSRFGPKQRAGYKRLKGHSAKRSYMNARRFGFSHSTAMKFAAMSPAQRKKAIAGLKRFGAARRRMRKSEEIEQTVAKYNSHHGPDGKFASGGGGGGGYKGKHGRNTSPNTPAQNKQYDSLSPHGKAAYGRSRGKGENTHATAMKHAKLAESYKSHKDAKAASSKKTAGRNAKTSKPLPGSRIDQAQRKRAGKKAVSREGAKRLAATSQPSAKPASASGGKRPSGVPATSRGKVIGGEKVYVGKQTTQELYGGQKVKQREIHDVDGSKMGTVQQLGPGRFRSVGTRGGSRHGSTFESVVSQVRSDHRALSGTPFPGGNQN